MSGWWNIDLKAGPGVDQTLDVREGLPFQALSLIFAEHFIEHLTLDEGLAFLSACKRSLAPSGTLRLSTPNLDWVWLTHYHPSQWTDDAAALHDCLMLNKAFHGWGHRCLYNPALLSGALRAAGFESVRFRRYGESEIPELRGLEHHEPYIDTPDLPHVLVVEASGTLVPLPLPPKSLADYRQAVAAR